ncbi:uncharacterized protein LOC125238323 isoform X2 [Leguminivora glycinivorella]|uniref:uncharacterized protein LOC125238323 isoform X2 n=1 Tax=Leguminivora glycinivorella TaxID=1035111 RepID=UPI00200C8B47|nr:uncharacterized protein LOC125238323 isoform X2 [Leguminivora glycinivorella]
MGKESPCGVCGETETRLVDGFYYCAECGTQDINLQETVVEHTLRADGTALVARRSRYRLNIDDGVEMSMEWYKWHKYNFLLAGLTEQLIELGAAPSLRMKVLWIWSRYIKMFQKKEEMGPAPVLSQLNVSSSSSEDEAEQEPADAAPRKGKRLDRVTCYLLVAILGLALNVDRSAILESRFTRLLRWRLVPVADIFRHVPAEILRKTRQHRRLFAASSMLTGFSLAPYLMCRVSKLLELGGPLTPDLDAIVHSQLRELRLPRALSQLVRALMHAAPVPFATRRKERFDKQQGERFPEYETTVMAYVMVALKMCFGLDDARERALSAAVDAINEEAGHPRAYTSDPEPTGRLFSFREWAAHLQLRALLTAAHCAPLAWSRAEPAQDLASLEQFRDHTVDHAADPHKSIKKGSKARLTDQVTMEILDRIPQRSAARVLSRRTLAPALAAREPAAAVARAVMDLLPPEQSRLLDEDFTHYSLDYAFKHLALPAARADSELFRGVRPRDAGGETFGSDVYYSLADAAPVFIKNCSNEHWAEAPRARLSRELDEHAERDSRESLEERRLETFLEEDDGCNIFDDDFSDIPIKDEKMDPNVGDAPEDVGLGDELDDWALPAVERSRRSRDTFDSDDEPEPQFDPRAFDRREVIKELLRGAYERCHLTQVPVRFLSHGEKTRTKADRAPADVPLREFTRGVGSEHWDNKLRARARTQRVEELLADYRRHLRGDALHQLERSVRAFTAAADADAVLEPDLTLHESALPEAADVDDSGDVELLENETKKDEDDEDSCEDRAYDPVLKSGADFDEKTHDVDRLFVRLKSPAPESEEPGIEVDDGLAAIVDRAIGKRTIKTPKKIETKVIETDVDHLVDDPERVTEFNYWFLKFDKHFQTAAGMPVRRMERALEAASPRGFWRVLKEAAAALAAPPLRLARRLADVEHRLLRLLATIRRTTRGGEPGRPRKNHERPERTNRYSKRKRGRPRKERRLEESDSPSNSDRRRETFEDVGASGNRDRSDINDSQECNPERLCEDLEDSSASQNKLRERKKPRKTMDSSSEDGEPRRSRWGRSGTRRRPETTGDDSEDSSGSGGRERPRTRGRPRQTRQQYISGVDNARRVHDGGLDRALAHPHVSDQGLEAQIWFKLD